jgi:hypothetical protein
LDGKSDRQNAHRSEPNPDWRDIEQGGPSFSA